MMSSIVLSSPQSSKSKRRSTSTNPRICPACSNPVTATRASRNARPGSRSGLTICACSLNKPNAPLAEEFAGRMAQMRREREKARLYALYPGGRESDIYAETAKAETTASPIQMGGPSKGEGKEEVGALHVEDVSDVEGRRNGDGFEDVDLAEGDVKKVAGAEEGKEEEEDDQVGGHEGYGAESREESGEDLMDGGFVIVEKDKGMIAEEGLHLDRAQTSQALGYWELASTRLRGSWAGNAINAYARGRGRDWTIMRA